MKVWEMENTDIVRFVITREQWNLLLEAIAGAAAWTSPENQPKMWNALDVLRSAEEDVDASKMVKALTTIAEMTKNRRGNDETIIYSWATNALKPAESE